MRARTATRTGRRSSQVFPATSAALLAAKITRCHGAGMQPASGAPRAIVASQNDPI
jgi:hypothetical protein